MYRNTSRPHDDWFITLEKLQRSDEGNAKSTPADIESPMQNMQSWQEPRTLDITTINTPRFSIIYPESFR